MGDGNGWLLGRCRAGARQKDGGEELDNRLRVAFAAAAAFGIVLTVATGISRGRAVSDPRILLGTATSTPYLDDTPAPTPEATFTLVAQTQVPATPTQIGAYPQPSVYAKTPTANPTFVAMSHSQYAEEYAANLNNGVDPLLHVAQPTTPYTIVLSMDLYPEQAAKLHVMEADIADALEPDVLFVLEGPYQFEGEVEYGGFRLYIADRQTGTWEMKTSRSLDSIMLYVPED